MSTATSVDYGYVLQTLEISFARGYCDADQVESGWHQTTVVIEAIPLCEVTARLLFL